MNDREKYIKENSKLAIVLAIEMLSEYPAMVKCGENFYEYNGKCYDMINKERLLEMFYEFCVTYGILASWKMRNDVIQAIFSSSKVPRVEKMNDHEDLICLNNGVININTRELVEHSKSFYFDSCVNVDYDANDNDCADFEGYLDHTFNQDADTIDNVIMLGGYLLDTSCKAEKMFLFDGSGGNGKSVLINAYSMFFSSSEVNPQVTSISLSDLSSDKFKKYDLITSRFNQCAEEKKGYIDVEEIKKIVSGDLINVDGKFKNTVNFHPKTKIVVAANGLPKFTDTSDGIYRRLVIIKFENQYKSPDVIKTISYAEEKRIFPFDLDLGDKIIAEKSAILNLFLDGLLRLKQRKYQFILGEKYESAMADFKKDSDSVYEFLNETYVIDPKVKTPLVEIYNNYRYWHKVNVQDSFGMKMRSNEMGRRIKEVFGLDSCGRETFQDTDTGKYKKLSVYNLKEIVVEPPVEDLSFEEEDTLGI